MTSEEAIGIVFKNLMIVTSFQFCIANGSHNIANAISPLLNVFMLYEIPINYGYLIGAVTMAIGLLSFGARVLETVGKKVIILDF